MKNQNQFKRKEKNSNLVVTSVNIEKNQLEFLKTENLSLSLLVRDLLTKLMKNK